MDSICKVIVRRRAIALITLVFVTFFLLFSSPPKGENFTSPSPRLISSASSAPLERLVQTSTPAPETTAVINDACRNCSLLTLDKLPEPAKKFDGNNNITSQLKSALSFIYSNHIPIILIEPCILWRILQPDEQKQLVTRRSASNLTTSCNELQADGNLFTFTLVQKYNDSTWQSIKQVLEENKFQVQLIETHGTLEHVVLKREQVVLHIALVKNRGNMHMIPPLIVPQADNLMKGLKLRVGEHESAFELISPMAVEVSSVYCIIPKEYQRFLFELPHSRFLECRHDLAKKWQEKFSLTQAAETKLNETLKVMRYLIFNRHLPIWMDGGSLLGWARHCSAIVHEMDADFASWAEIHDNKYNLTNDVIKSLHAPWYVIETFGLPWAAYEMRLFNVKLNWQVDLFFMTQDEEDAKSVYSGYHTFPAVSYYKVYYEKKFFKQLCSGEIYGNKILVPCAYDDVLVSEYGDKWVIPDTHHFLKTQSRSHKSSWLLHEAPYAYQCLGRYQFDVREMKHDNYKYNSTLHEKDTVMAQPIQDILNEYKRVCNHFRWDRTS